MRLIIFIICNNILFIDSHMPFSLRFNTMFVCLCNQVTTHDIEQVMAEGNLSFEEVQQELGVADCCGQCEDFARNLVNENATKVKSDLFYEAA